MPNSTAPHSQSRPRRSLNRPLPGSPRRWRPFTEDEVGWWPITFSDLVLLLFCFFVLWHVSDKQRAVAAARVVQPIPTRSGATAALTDVPLSPAPEPAAETVLPADRKGALQTRTNPTDTALLTIRDPRSAIHNPPAPALLTEQPEPALLPSVPVPRPDTGSPAADFDWQNM
ncbi:MAG: hypothetical protein HYZ72_15505, partial [Deltaproteobacteria bacterium]|nr:hypothetical protein [Deltaproteobacteria bacterium]